MTRLFLAADAMKMLEHKHHTDLKVDVMKLLKHKHHTDLEADAMKILWNANII